MSKVTLHAKKRGHERLGLSGRALSNTAEKALFYGLNRHGTHGALRRYLDRKHTLHPHGELVIYGEQVFVFVSSTLVTCWNLPHELKRAALGQWRKKKEADHV